MITLLLIILAQLNLSLQDPLVELPNGQILGREVTTSENKKFFAFEKIPYAAPPVGNLRFQPPQPPESWTDVLNTTHLDVVCHQLSPRQEINEDEDCLYLNVFTPKVSEEGELLPVIFYIHDGAFARKSSLISAVPPDLFMNHDVVFVSFNFRLGVFGFLSTEDSTLPGNNGLKDQLFALQWVHNNINLFGGDPDRLTIMGQSSGGQSSSLHLLNQNSSGLINAAILQSGTFLDPDCLNRNSRKNAFGLGEILNSTFESSDELLEFLQSVDAEDLHTAAVAYSEQIRNNWDLIVGAGGPFGPTIESKNPDAFITKKMYGLLKAGSILAVPTLLGITSEEKIGNVQRNEDMLDEIVKTLDQNLELIVPTDMQISDSANLTEMGRSIRALYTGGDDFIDNLANVVRYSSDNFVNRADIKYAELFSPLAPTFFYQFSFLGALDAQNGYFDGAGRVAHGSDLQYLMCGGEDCTDSTIPEADLLTRQRLIKLWTNFVKYKNPTPEPNELLQNVTWPQLSVAGGDFLYLDIDEDLTVKNHPKEETYSKWVELYNSLGNDDFDTY